MIDWKATVQRSVTKSTTESELMALSLAGSKMEEWMRFFKGIHLKLDCKPTIWCDNKQTVGIATKDEDRLRTTGRHVDVHHLWIRQEIEEERLGIEWVPTKRMPADGLTKILPTQKFKEFQRQCGLVDISTRLKGLKNAEIKDVTVQFPNRY